MVVEQRAAPLAHAYLTGEALRWGFPVPIPWLAKLGTVEPRLTCRSGREEFHQEIKWNCGGIPVWGAG